MISNTLKEQQVLRSYLIGSLAYTGGYYEDIYGAAIKSFNWFQELFTKGIEGWPLGVICDLGHMIEEREGFRYRSLWEYSSWRQEEREIRLAYENDFINLLFHDSSFHRLIVAVADAGKENHVIVRALELILRPVNDEHIQINPYLLRNLLLGIRLEPDTEARRFEEYIDFPNYFLQKLKLLCSTFSSPSVLTCPLREEDYYEIENFSVFSKPRQRLASRELKSICSQVEPYDTRKRPKTPEISNIETSLTHIGTFPAGGITELSNHGSIENLLSSELIYIEENSKIDLFDLRYVEGELLFFMREEGQLQRQRRSIHILLLTGDWMRLKHKLHRFRMDVLVEGFILRLIDDLFTILSHENLQITLNIVSLDPISDDEEDVNILSLMLRHYEELGLIKVNLSTMKKDSEISSNLFVKFENTLVFLEDKPWRKIQLVSFIGPKASCPRTKKNVEHYVIRFGEGSGDEDKAFSLDNDPIESLGLMRDWIIDALIGLQQI